MASAGGWPQVVDGLLAQIVAGRVLRSRGHRLAEVSTSLAKGAGRDFASLPGLSPSG